MKTILGTGQLGLAIMQLLLDKKPDEKILLINRSGKLNITIPQNVKLIHYAAVATIEVLNPFNHEYRNR